MLFVKKNLLSFVMVTLLLAAACKKTTVTGGGDNPPPPPVIEAPPAFGYYVVGYLPSYRDPDLIPAVKYRMCNVVNYAFATINSSGLPVVQTPANLTLTVLRARAQSAKIFISLNGNHTDWRLMATGATGRTNFIKATMDIVRQYGLDGVDVDWEFPTTSDGTDATYTLLMKELSDSCHFNRKYYLTAAVTAGKYAGSIRDAIRSEIFTYVDFLNIMAYDDFNTAAPYKHHSDLALANTCLNYWRNTRGLPAAKCVLGIPAYGRPSGISQTGSILTYSNILTRGGSPASDSAQVTVGGINGGNPYTVYYNGQPTVKIKAALARTNANGVMFWEKGQDDNGSFSLLKAACDTVGRIY
jgi:chitinase